MNYELWLEQNEDELLIVAAEQGLDREYDWDPERWFEKLFFEEYPDG